VGDLEVFPKPFLEHLMGVYLMGVCLTGVDLVAEGIKVSQKAFISRLKTPNRVVFSAFSHNSQEKQKFVTQQKQEQGKVGLIIPKTDKEKSNH
jgi:hypothetical protein